MFPRIKKNCSSYHNNFKLIDFLQLSVYNRRLALENIVVTASISTAILLWSIDLINKFWVKL